MKKSVRLVALVLALVLLCGLTTGCQAIDDMRAKQATLSDDNRLLFLNGTAYRLLPENDYFAPFRQSGENVNITEAGVPVLLATYVKKSTGWLYNDGVIISTYTGYYCRVDQYKQYEELLQQPFNPTGYGYNYSTYNEQTGRSTQEAYRLTDEQAAAIEYITGQPSFQRDKTFVDEQMPHHSINLYACDDTMQLRESRYLLEKYSRRDEENATIYYTLASNNDRNVAWSVPAELNGMMADIMNVETNTSETVIYK